MLARFISLLLLIVFAVGFISEFVMPDVCDETPVPAAEAAIENPQEHSIASQAPFDDCAEGAPCTGHCHFGQCRSVILASAPQISSVSFETKHFTIYRLPAMRGFPATHFRPPIA